MPLAQIVEPTVVLARSAEEGVQKSLVSGRAPHEACGFAALPLDRQIDDPEGVGPKVFAHQNPPDLAAPPARKLSREAFQKVRRNVKTERHGP